MHRLLDLVLRSIAHIEFIVAALLRHELPVVPLLQDLSAVNDQNAVRVSYGGQAVGHHKAGSGAQQGFNGSLNLLLRFRYTKTLFHNQRSPLSLLFQKLLAFAMPRNTFQSKQTCVIN